MASVAADRMNKRSLSGGSVLAPIPPMHGEAPMDDTHDRQRFMHMEGSAQAHPGYEGPLLVLPTSKPFFLYTAYTFHANRCASMLRQKLNQDILTIFEQDLKLDPF